MTEPKNKIEAKPAEESKFKGKFLSATGRRKRATARVRLYKNGAGLIVVNGMNLNQYFSAVLANIAVQPLKLSGHMSDLNFSIVAAGGGKKGQAGAVKHGFARALMMLEGDLKPSLRAKGHVTRDARKKERKKPGLKKARRAPQWAKR